MSPQLRFRENVLLAPYTTFRIGGPARWFVEVRSEEDVLTAVQFAHDRQLPLFVIGGGSNLLVADAGFAGLVLHISMSGMVEHEGVFSVAAGESWDAFVGRAVERKFGGIECLAGIPGTVGGSPVQNVGAYGQEVSATIQRVRAFDTVSADFVDLHAEECGFAYRQSIFNTTQRGRYIVTVVDFSLVRDAAPQLSYADLVAYFKASGTRPSLAETAEAVREIRRRKGMLLVDGDADCQSAGSFFKNPVIDLAAIDGIASALRIEALTVPRYPATDGKVKLPAAWLLEQAGFHKGFTRGPAAISSRHTLALTNRGSANASDMLALRDQIVETVWKRFAIRLEQEPVLLG